MENECFRKTCRAIVRGIIKIFYRVEYFGESYPDEGAYIICPNHFSILDIVFVLVHARKRWVYFMAKSELYKHKFSAWFLNKMELFLSKEDKVMLEVLKSCYIA